MQVFWGLAGTALLILVMSTPRILDKVNQEAEIQKAKAGLEECPIKPGNYDTIWVKSCKEYSEISKDY